MQVIGSYAMVLRQEINLKQSQNMVMTPQLRQSIEILQLATVDLNTYLNNELEKNPFLIEDNAEIEEKSDEAAINGQSDSDKYKDKKENRNYEEDNIATVTEAVIGKSEIGWSDDSVSPAVYEDDSLVFNYGRSSISASGSFSEDGEYGFENTSAPDMTLKEYIIDQINIEIKGFKERVIALAFTDALDENGYLTVSAEDIADSLKCGLKAASNILIVLQNFDPPGVFARNLQECLAFQLRDRNHLDPAIIKLLENLDLLAKCEFSRLKKICGVNDEDLKHMIDEIKTLNPKPGRNFVSEQVQTIQADVFLKKNKGAKWIVELNTEALPRVLVNRRYYSQIEIHMKDEDKKSRKFLSEQLNNANWLIKALDQRARTILKVATAIVERQEQFFTFGIKCLKPLILSDIAKDIQMHESTVSRVINGKYIATNMGMFELKYFFSSSLAGDDAANLSSTTVKHVIKQLIGNEDKVLSDEKIVLLLKKQGINAARRTVTKYREAMNIPSSVQRRRNKKLK